MLSCLAINLLLLLLLLIDLSCINRIVGHFSCSSCHRSCAQLSRVNPGSRIGAFRILPSRINRILTIGVLPSRINRILTFQSLASWINRILTFQILPSRINRILTFRVLPGVNLLLLLLKLLLLRRGIVDRKRRERHWWWRWPLRGPAHASDAILGRWCGALTTSGRVLQVELDLVDDRRPCGCWAEKWIMKRQFQIIFLSCFE